MMRAQRRGFCFRRGAAGLVVLAIGCAATPSQVPACRDVARALPHAGPECTQSDAAAELMGAIRGRIEQGINTGRYRWEVVSLTFQFDAAGRPSAACPKDASTPRSGLKASRAAQALLASENLPSASCLANTEHDFVLHTSAGGRD